MDAEEEHTEGGILGAALDAGVDTADAVEDVGKAHDLDVGRGQVDEGLVGGDKAQHLGGEEEGDEGQHRGKAGDGVESHADTAVDVVGVPPAPVLAYQHRHAALEAEDHHLDNEDGHVGGGDRRHLRVAQQAHHKGVGKAQGGGDKVLEDNGQAQPPQTMVKAGLPAQTADDHRKTDSLL